MLTPDKAVRRLETMYLDTAEIARSGDEDAEGLDPTYYLEQLERALVAVYGEDDPLVQQILEVGRPVFSAYDTVPRALKPREMRLKKALLEVCVKEWQEKAARWKRENPSQPLRTPSIPPSSATPVSPPSGVPSRDLSNRVESPRAAIQRRLEGFQPPPGQVIRNERDLVALLQDHLRGASQDMQLDMLERDPITWVGGPRFVFPEQDLVILVHHLDKPLTPDDLQGLIISNVERFKGRYECRWLVYFFHDPQHLIREPREMESTYSHRLFDISVRLMVVPKP